MFCTNCNGAISRDADFCPNCGTKIDKKNKKIIVLVAIAILIILFTVILFFWINQKKNNKNYDSTSFLESVSYSYTDTNILKFIDGKFSDNLVKDSDDALRALESIKYKIGCKDIDKELRLNQEEKSENITYYKFDQIYNEIPVLYQNIIISVDKDNNILSYSGYFIPNIDIDTKPVKNKQEIEEIIKEYLGINSTIVSNELNIWADYENQDLVYVVIGYSDTKAVEIIVDANTGEILSETSVFDYASTYSYTGKGMDDNTYTINLEEYEVYADALLGAKKYRFYDLERKISIIDSRYIGPILATLVSAIPEHNPITVDIINNKIDMTGQNEDFIQNAITTMANYETIYDYYKNVLGRDSYDNKGSQIFINLGVSVRTFSSKDLDNAMWNSLTNQMYIGNWNGKSLSASLDVLAHEFTHGVINHTANFAGSAKKEDKNKAFETGALNEGYSDILGSLIEEKNWTIAENNEVLRSLANPNAYEYAAIKGGKYYYPDGYLSENRTLEEFLNDNDLKSVYDYDGGGKHQNATVPGHAAYLMWENGAFTSKEEMAKVWYNSLFLLSSYSNFEDCALAVIKTAKNQGLSSNSVRIIEEAFMATKMLEDTRIEISGVVHNSGKYLNNVKIELNAENSQNPNYEFKTDTDGKFSEKIQAGTYVITITKDDFEEYKKTITIHGETSIDIELARAKKQEKKDSNILKCESGNCHTLIMYFLEDFDVGLKENYETYSVDDGTVLGTDLILNTVNNTFGKNLIKTDGETFKITINDFTLDFAWYYKSTNTKFDFNKPITEDIEIEMKLYEGSIDNSFIKDIYDFFNP